MLPEIQLMGFRLMGFLVFSVLLSSLQACSSL